MANAISTINVSGTSTERTAFALTLAAKDAGLLFYEVSGATYEWNGSAFVQKSSAGGASVSFVGDYPIGATAVTAASGNVANAAAAATLAAVVGKTTYMTGFQITGAGATAGLPVIATVTGLISGTASYIVVAAVGALVANTPIIARFNQAIPGSATNTAIVISVPAFGLGNTHSAVAIQGYNL